MQTNTIYALMLSLLAIAASTCASGQTTPSSQIESRLKAAMNSAYAPGEPGAAVIVTRGSTTLLRTAVGSGELELDVPLSPDMIFRIGSLTKQFTAAAILKLEEQSKLSVDDPVGKHFPEFPKQARAVTIRQLLTHTSGISTAHTHMRQDFTVSELVDLFINAPLSFEPGERFEYNNNNYIVLGAVIERVSGLIYADFLRNQFFAPLGMNDTSYDDYSSIIKNRAKGYQGGKDNPRNADFVSMSIPYAAGALISSVDDMNTWNRALFGGRVISDASLESMTTGAVDVSSTGQSHGHHDGVAGSYGFGLFIGELDGRTAFKHSGSVEGFLSYSLFIPDAEVSIVVLQNTSSWGDPQGLAEQLAMIALDAAK